MIGSRAERVLQPETILPKASTELSVYGYQAKQ